MSGTVLSIERQLALLAELARLSAERSAAEAAAEVQFRSANEEADRGFQERQEAIAARHESETMGTQEEFDHLCQRQIPERFEREQADAQEECREALAKIAEGFESQTEAAQRHCEEACWEARTIFDANNKLPTEKLEAYRLQLDDLLSRLETVQVEAGQLVARWRQQQAAAACEQAAAQLPAGQGAGPAGAGSATAAAAFGPVAAKAAAAKETVAPADALGAVQECVGLAESRLAQLAALQLPTLFQGIRPAALLAAVIALSLAPAALSGRWLFGAVMAVVGGLVGGLLGALLHAIARFKVSSVYLPLCQTLPFARRMRQQGFDEATAICARQTFEFARARDLALREAEEVRDRALHDATFSRQRDSRQALERCRRRQEAATEQRDREARLAGGKFPRLLRDIRSQFEHGTSSAEARRAREHEEAELARGQAWNALAGAWRAGLHEVYGLVDRIHDEAGGLCPPWNAADWKGWTPAAAMPPAVRFGSYRVRMDQFEAGVPADERLRQPLRTEFALPALLSFPTGCSLLVKTKGQGQEEAAALLQSVMLRMLTTIPPGKVRFTIIDPVGLGENFAAFMHLADYDESLVGKRIWTEPEHIEQRLVDLTEQMGTIIQKYLRNEFETIDEYNRHAGEIAEPYRMLVVANFPAGFSESAARRLVSIAASGSRCGVHTLVSVDARLALPQDFDLADLEQHSVVLQRKGGRFAWKHDVLGRYELETETPPDPARFTAILQKVGEAARNASRVEVPFEVIAPKDGQWWTSHSRKGLRVPLGRAGATKLQYLSLGQGTSQHVLVAGKTGSGKSTLLHALVTNLALTYSPDEVQLYLVDFKKGVEFKTYAAHALPHARVVAIESDREFGLSVLERLDSELKRRGDQFRDARVQDVAGFREAHPGQPLPRMLLVVDEFQELFTEDDKIAQDAALLLDRLVRQGRAFGIHVLLGSQTLGGAYSLARSTVGQMAVRIALQCSETDAHLILSEDNSAARLLSRPGEAIYNDANGLVEGNHPFQVVWLPEARREDYLQRVRAMAEAQQPLLNGPQIVFEGNVPADLSKNEALAELLYGGQPRTRGEAPCAWLGEPVAIKDPTAAIFRRQSGGNLLMVGQNQQGALGITLAGLVSLAAQRGSIAAERQNGADEPVTYYLIDAVGGDEAALTQLAGLRPGLRIFSRREAAAAVAELAGEVERRLADADGPPRYLFIYGLQNCRDLRKQDDDFGFSRMGEEGPPSPAKQFATVLREGPALGVHTLAWCDNLNNLNRTFERQLQREFEMRVLFQMSPADSTQLIDTPLAGKLGPYRALYYSEEAGQVEKFRPYGPPAETWLAGVMAQLAGGPNGSVGEASGGAEKITRAASAE